MEKEGKWQRIIPALLFPISSPDYTNLGMLVLCGNFLKICGPSQDAICDENCGIMPCLLTLHICIKLAYGKGENDSSCGKICNMHGFGKYANNAAIAYLHKTGMPNQFTHWLLCHSGIGLSQCISSLVDCCSSSGAALVSRCFVADGCTFANFITNSLEPFVEFSVWFLVSYC